MGVSLAEFVPEKPASRLEWETTVPLNKVSWLAVRCFEPAEGTIRFAHSGPIYVHGRNLSPPPGSGSFLSEMDRRPF